MEKPDENPALYEPLRAHPRDLEEWAPACAKRIEAEVGPLRVGSMDVGFTWVVGFRAGDVRNAIYLSYATDDGVFVLREDAVPEVVRSIKEWAAEHGPLEPIGKET